MGSMKCMEGRWRLRGVRGEVLGKGWRRRDWERGRDGLNAGAEGGILVVEDGQVVRREGGGGG